MITVRISGGLGNQLFQFAFALMVASKTKKSVTLDTSSYEALSASSDRKLEIESMAKSASLLIKSCRADLIEDTYNEYISKSRLSGRLKVPIAVTKILIYHRVLLHPKFFGRLSNLAFRLPVAHLILPSDFDVSWINQNVQLHIVNSLSEESKRNIAKFAETDWVGIHVRRGDYTDKSSVHEVLPAEYFRAGMLDFCQRFPESKFLFFSDDVAWCKENLESKGCEMNFVQECINLTLLEEFYLLSLLDKAIISNSTFSLFAACLGNKDKTVVFPTHWFIDGREAQKKFPKKWIRSAVF